VNSFTKLAAMSIIALGGALVGVIGGWNFGSLTIDLNQQELASLGAGGGVTLAVIGCFLASEYAEARARNQQHLIVLKRLPTMLAGVRSEQ
jgi:hypothetical protein